MAKKQARKIIKWIIIDLIILAVLGYAAIVFHQVKLNDAYKYGFYNGMGFGAMLQKQKGFKDA